VNLSQSLSAFVPGLNLDPSIAAWALLMMIGLGLATGLVPAINAFRLKIADAMGRG
jgi:putative ABC transport system permease protein